MPCSGSALERMSNAHVDILPAAYRSKYLGFHFKQQRRSNFEMLGRGNLEFAAKRSSLDIPTCAFRRATNNS